MGLLDRLELGIEKAVHGVFSRGSNAQVQPVEIASRLRRVMDGQAISISQGRTLAPNVFEARLGDTDFDRVQQWGQPLAEELCDVAVQHARSQGYTLQGPVRFSFKHDGELKPGTFEVTARSDKGESPAAPGRPRVPSAPPAPSAPPRRPVHLHPVLEIDGQRYSLNADSIVLGRSSEADIVVDDTGVSRRHIEIRQSQGRFYAVDLGSTNGSYVNGERVNGTAELLDGSVISMGRTRITFRMLPAPLGGTA
ncbi:FhaA domain-containing protein [Sinomonas sp. P47F7]|uniref:FhaA domain-containing protein n=1 Tax=Sinomonas sp. P47F7 TaxID=3410987 RepID=UPI003BF4B2CF